MVSLGNTLQIKLKNVLNEGNDVKKKNVKNLEHTNTNTYTIFQLHHAKVVGCSARASQIQFTETKLNVHRNDVFHHWLTVFLIYSTFYILLTVTPCPTSILSYLHLWPHFTTVKR